MYRTRMSMVILQYDFYPWRSWRPPEDLQRDGLFLTLRKVVYILKVAIGVPR